MKNDLIVILANKRKTVADVHEATGIPINEITDIYYERANNFSIQTLLKICSYLDITLDQLVSSSNYNEKRE